MNLQETGVSSVKAFKTNLTGANGYKFEFGETYTHEGEVILWKSGFHACEYPLDVLRRYSPITSRFALVRQLDGITRTDPSGNMALDSTVCSKNINIGTEVDVQYLVMQSATFTKSRCTAFKMLDVSNSSSNTEYRSLGNYTIAHSTGIATSTTASGYGSIAANAGARSFSQVDGSTVISSVTADYSVSVACGPNAVSAATGVGSGSYTSGRRSLSAVTGIRSISTALGSQTISAATGLSCVSSASGDHAASVTTSSSCKSTASGNSAVSLAVGMVSSSEVTNSVNGVAIGTGKSNRVKAGLGCAIVLVRRNSDYNITHITSGIIGENGLKPDVWYELNNTGEFVEVENTYLQS